MAHDWVELQAEPLDTSGAIARVSGSGAGGIAVFLGTTRAETSAAGARLLALHYEAFAEMVEKQLNGLARRARDRWPVLSVAILHRVGRVGLGEPSVVIAVSTPHRAEAFEACRWLIDTLKSEAAIWKKEIWEDGAATWVDPEPSPV